MGIHSTDRGSLLVGLLVLIVVMSCEWRVAEAGTPAPPPPDSCQELGSSNDCFSCLLKPGCGYCEARQGGAYSGCFEKDPNNNNRPNSSAVCADVDNTQGDNWIANPDGCRDSCLGSSERRTCEKCVEVNGCGFCQDGGGCRTAAPDSVGPTATNASNARPWYNFTYCQDFRYLGDSPMDQINMNELCSVYRSCKSEEASADCASCLDTYEAYGQGCIWCEGGPEVEGESRCAPANATCNPASTKISDLKVCPNTDTSAAGHNNVISYLFLIPLLAILLQ